MKVILFDPDGIKENIPYGRLIKNLYAEHTNLYDYNVSNVPRKLIICLRNNIATNQLCNVGNKYS